MVLDRKDAKLFYELMWDLQFYAKERLDLMPEVRDREVYANMDGENRLDVRNAVWDNPQLIADYVRENPDNLDSELLAIVSDWQNFVAGKFIVERILKKYAIFIQENAVYGVIGLLDELEDLLPKASLPLYVEAVLLPFKGVVIYDGLLPTYSLSFGGGIKESLKQVYNKAKRKGEIIVSFDADVQQAHQAATKKKLKDWKPALEALTQEAKSLRAESGSPPTWSPAFSLVKASLALAETAVNSPEDRDALWEKFDKLAPIANRLENSIFRS